MFAPTIYRATNHLLVHCFYFLLALVPLVFSPSNYELFEFPKMILVYATTVVILALWAVKSILVGRPIFHRTLLDLPLLLFLLAQSASTFFSIDRHTSIWGFYTRSYGGLLSIVTFTLLYWAYVSNMEKRKTKNVIRFLLASAAVVSFWGILEHLGHSPGCLLMKGKFDASCWEPDVSARVFASFGQPNWMAAWLAAIAPLSWAIANAKVKSQKSTLQSKIQNLLLPAISATIFTAILYTKSASGLVGLSAGYLVFWGITLARQRSTAVRPFLIFTFSFLILASALGTRFTPSIGQIWQQHRTNNLSQSASNATPSASDGTDSWQIRKIIWKGATDIWRAYPLFGSGVETFAYTYYNFRPVEHNLTSEWDLLYNKAHNEYLHYLANTGLVGLAAYILLITTFVAWNCSRIFNSHFSILQTALLAGYASILVTNIVGFTTVPVAILFFLYPAMAFTATRDTPHVTRYTKTAQSTKKLLSITLVSLVTCYLLVKIYDFHRADTLYARADKLNDAGGEQAAAELLEKAIKLRPGEPRYYNELASSYSLTAASFAEDANEENRQKAPNDALLAEEFSDKALAISPRNVNFWSNRSVVFKRLVGIDQKYLNLATQALEQAVTLAPTEPEIHHNLGVLYTRSSQSEKAQQFLEKAIILKTDYYDGRLGLAEFYLQEGKNEAAAKQLEYILEKINPGDKTVKEILETLRQEKQ